eukprot:5236545-Pyramimonas_sp.AAC.1
MRSPLPLLWRATFRLLQVENRRGGWFRTGDLARVLHGGYVQLVDRAKDMVLTGGENVYSAEVEHALCAVRRQPSSSHHLLYYQLQDRFKKCTLIYLHAAKSRHIYSSPPGARDVLGCERSEEP